MREGRQEGRGRDVQGLPRLREGQRRTKRMNPARLRMICAQDYETDRALINATLPARDVSETYLPPFIGV